MLATYYIIFSLISYLTISSLPLDEPDVNPAPIASEAVAADCNCTITQAGATYPINALESDQSAVQFYSYGIPNFQSANTGLEVDNGLIIFMYCDTTTNITSVFLIVDIANSGSGGSMAFEMNCVPDSAYISVEDDVGEFSGMPPTLFGNWNWQGCCTDGGVIENIGCTNSFTLDLLVSNGIDSAMWLVGDISAPDQIPLSIDGEFITINCGGGVCCPVDFDSEITITDATCPDVPDGSISVAPVDGTPGYSFSWSNGASTPDLTNLLAGTYFVTVTDNLGCTEELEIEVGISPGIPPTSPAEISLCSETNVAVFDLTSVENIINGDAGITIEWFSDAGASTPITDPANYSSMSTTIYAVANNGFCLSEPVPVVLEVLVAPVADTASLLICEENDGMATFDLTTLDDQISGGGGDVMWYQDSTLNSLIGNPTAYFSGSTSVFAVVTDGVCFSPVVEVPLTVSLLPIGETAQLNMCSDIYGEAVFDLTSLEPSIGIGEIDWYHNASLTLEIVEPDMFSTSSVTVYATIFDGLCVSVPIPVVLVVDETPVGNPVTISACDDGSGSATFDLWQYENDVTGGTGNAEWYLNSDGTGPIPNPGDFESGPTVIFATVTDDICISSPVPVTLEIIDNPVANSVTIETCADSTGIGIFDLTASDTEISGGSGTVTWFEDLSGNVEVADPTEYLSSGGLVYAQVMVGSCESEIVPVDLIIVSSVSANPIDISACTDGSGTATFDLTSFDGQVSGGSGTVMWFEDPAGSMPINSPDSYTSGSATVYANVTAGDCISDIVAIGLSTVSAPSATAIVDTVCGDTNAVVVFDLTSLDPDVSGGAGSVEWYLDSLATLPISDPTDFSTGDTIVYALVSDSVCKSPTVEINLTVLEGVVPNPIAAEYCLRPGDSIEIDLTQYDDDVSGGLGVVAWYIDAVASIPIITPNAFNLSVSETVYATVTYQGCVSQSGPVAFDVVPEPVVNDLLIGRCGDANNQVQLDLTSLDSLISPGGGDVTWYWDTTAFTEVPDPGMLVTGDTTVFALASDSICTSDVAIVTISVVSNLEANSPEIEICTIGESSATIDLTDYDLLVSVSGSVIWFADPAGIDTISDPENYITSGGMVYVQVTDGDCSSEIVPVIIQFEISNYPDLVCAYTGTDSVEITWNDVASEYQISFAINGISGGSPSNTTSNSFSLGGLNEGDSVTLWVVALFDSVCTAPLESEITCIVDACPTVVIELPGLDSAYCQDVLYVALSAIPAGGTFSGSGVIGDTLFPSMVAGPMTTVTYDWVNPNDGCSYMASVPVNIYEPLAIPQASCDTSTLTSVSILWSGTAGAFGYIFSVNGGPLSSPVVTGETSLTVSDLQEGDEVTFSVWAIAENVCGNSDTVTISCFASDCPPAEVSIIAPGNICSDGGTIQLEVTVTGLSDPELTWGGEGVSADGVFDPTQVQPGEVVVTVQAEEDNCIYDAQHTIAVVETPVAAMEVSGVPCADSTMRLSFVGSVPSGTEVFWDLNGGISTGDYPLNFDVMWDAPGDYEVSVYAVNNGCWSDTVRAEVILEAAMSAPVVSCVEEQLDAILIEWLDVDGASSYEVEASAGQATVVGNTATISDVTPGSSVEILVTAMGETVCGPVSAGVVCSTSNIPAPVIFAPNVFSPNGDGINDMFYLQTNEEVEIIDVLRIFDRWGALVFEVNSIPPNDPSYGWDGTVKGKQANPGVFVYALTYRTRFGEEFAIKGDITLLR